MAEAKRKGLENQIERLILAAEDMEQAIAAAVALQTDASADEALTRAIETAMAVCYMRPFTEGGWKLPNKYVPRGGAEGEIHRRLRELRNEVYAHSGKKTLRSASMKRIATSAGIKTISYGASSWGPLSVDDPRAIQAWCERQRQRFLEDAVAIHDQLEVTAETV